jgi:hypothetical protein
MKLFYLFIFIGSMLFIGCSTTFQTTNFKSKKEFNAYINHSVRNKKFNITFVNDSTIECEKGVQVQNDKIVVQQNKTVIDTTFPLNKIENINYGTYSANSFQSGQLELSNGITLDATNIRTVNDSIKFDSEFSYQKGIPIDKVRSLSYNNHWKGVLPGFLGGALSGAIIGGLVLKPKSGGNPPLQVNTFQAAVEGAAIGIIIGPIIGYIIGHNYNFEFR